MLHAFAPSCRAIPFKSLAFLLQIDQDAVLTLSNILFGREQVLCPNEHTLTMLQRWLDKAHDYYVQHASRVGERTGAAREEVPSGKTSSGRPDD